MSAMSGRHYQSFLNNSLAIRQEIQRFESVHPSIYAIYDLIELIPEAAVAQQIRDHVVCIEDSFVNSQEWTLSRGVPDLRLGIVGSLSSGKSALVHRYLTGSYMQEESPEGGRFKKEIMVDGLSYLLLIRDEGGPPDLQFTSWVDAVIFVFSLENEASFNAIYNYYTKMAHYRNATDIPLILVGTQDAISENNPRVIDDSRARKLATDLKRCSYYETCATYGLNVERVFQDACQKIVQQRLSGQFSAPVPGTPTNSRPSTPNSHFSTMIPVGNLTLRHYSQPSPTNGPINTSSSSGGSPSTNNTHGPGSPNHLPHKETISRQIHTFSASSHQLHRHPDIISKSEVSSKAEEKRAGSYATLGPSHTHALVESNNVKLGPGQNLDNLAPPGKEKDLPTPSSTPTTSRKSRRRSNLFTSSKKEDDRVKNGELGSGRAIPLKQGLLYKRSSKSLNKEWKKKYVTLCEDGRLIYYPNLQDYMSNIHGKEISLQYVTVKVPGQKPRGSRSIIPTTNGLNDGFSNLSLSGYLGKDKRLNEKSLLSAFEPVKDSGSIVLPCQTDEGISSISTAFTNGTDHRIETPNVKKRHRRMKSSGVKNAECDDPGGYEFFIVSLNNKQWHFEASNSEERDDWVSAIEQQILNSLQGNEISKSRSRFTMVDTTSLTAIKIKVPGNNQCVDCEAPKPSWASINLGVLMCIECSGIHRNLGSHISRVRSLDLDEWPPGPLSLMLVTGNAMANSIWEWNTGNQTKPNPSSCGEEKERWIKAKYENKEFLASLTSSQPIDQQLVDAVCRADIKAVMLILAHATPDDVNCTVSARDLRTPLHLAAAMGNLSIAQLLIWYGANPKILDQEGRSCLSYAMTASCKTSADSTSLINLLTDAGAVPESGSGRRESGGRIDLPSFNKKNKRSIDIISSLEHVSDVRLPRDVTPLAYNLELQPFIEEGEFQGHVTINITCLEDTDKIILHAHQDVDISEGDVSVSLLPSTSPGEEEKAQTENAIIFTSTTHSKAVTVEPTQLIKTVESNIASVPVGAARLLPASSSFFPENICSSPSTCTASSEKESERLGIREILPKPELLMSNKPTDSHIHRAVTEAAHTTTVLENVTETTQKTGFLQPTPPKSFHRLIPLTITKTERQLSRQWYIIYVSGGLKRGENYQLDLKFAGSLLTNSKDGFFVETYVNKDTGEKRQYVATQMRPNHARRVFPCFDEPSYKVPFEIHLARNPSMVAISNMPVAHTEPSPTEKEWVWDHFQPTLPMSTFSLAVLISDLQQVELPDTQGNDEEPGKVAIWGRKGVVTQLKSAAKVAANVIKELEMFFGMPLPVPKLDLIALPGYTAIPDSNWGVIFFKESDLFTDEHLVKQIAREVVYQWVGNLITPHWWSDVHINKALCNFIACIISPKVDESIIPNSALWTKNYPLYYEYGRNQPYKQLPSQKPPKTVTKSELILRMLNYTLSETTFQKAIQQLLGERQYKTFTQDDIWGALTEQAGMDGTLPEPATINQIADSWIKKERLPLVTIIRNYETNTGECEQTVFIRDHLEENSTNVEENLTWMIPLVIVFQNNLNFTSLKPLVWMKEEKKITINNLPSSSFFVLANPEEIGPFIVNYDLHNWALISEFLEKYGNIKQIPAATRAKLIHDSLNLAYAGNLRFDAALNVTKFLRKEMDPIVWQAAFNMFDHIQRHLEGSDTGKKFQEYVKYLVSNVYSYLEKLESKFTKSQERMYKSAKSALCSAGYPPCVNEARMQFKKWMEFNDPDAGIPISQSHFCWVFKWGTKEEWEFGLDRYLKYPSHLKQSDRYYLLKTLVSCPTNAWNVERVLNMTLLDTNSTITDGNARFILSVLSNQAGYTALFNLLADNWDAVKNRFDNTNSGLWDNIVSAATRNFKNQDGLDMVSELYVERQGEFGSAEAVIEQSLKHIKKEVKWNEENLPRIDQWLNEFLSSTASIP